MWQSLIRNRKGGLLKIWNVILIYIWKLLWSYGIHQSLYLQLVVLIILMIHCILHSSWGRGFWKPFNDQLKKTASGKVSIEFLSFYWERGRDGPQIIHVKWTVNINQDPGPLWQCPGVSPRFHKDNLLALQRNGAIPPFCPNTYRYQSSPSTPKEVPSSCQRPSTPGLSVSPWDSLLFRILG